MAASAAFFCCMAWCSAKRKPTRWVILMYRPAQCSMQVISDLSNVFERNDDTHPSKHRSTNPLYIVRLSFNCIYGCVDGDRDGDRDRDRDHRWRNQTMEKDRQERGFTSDFFSVCIKMCSTVKTTRFLV